MCCTRTARQEDLLARTLGVSRAVARGCENVAVRAYVCRYDKKYDALGPAVKNATGYCHINNLYNTVFWTLVQEGSIHSESLRGVRCGRRRISVRTTSQ